MIRNILIFLLGYVSNATFAQHVGYRWAHGSLADLVTLSNIEGITSVQLIRNDSVVSEGYATNTKEQGRVRTLFKLPVVEGHYLLRISNDDYSNYEDSLHIVFRRREKEIKLGRILLKRRMSERPIELAEVEVKASRIKFYFDNDTLVYDAAAFTTQKGFVLNDVLRKMPGLEIKSNGDIFSNGRRIDELLLNGKNFFNKDRKTILENLPGFMLKNVKIYEKKSDSSALIKRDREIEGLVMDVQLKREYKQAALLRGEAGYGTDNRYYEKLFGMKFHSLYRVSGYGVTNNINRDESFDNDGIGVNNDDGAGDKKTTLAGIRYDVDHSQGSYSLEGDVKFSYVDAMNTSETFRQQFFTSGDVYGHSVRRSDKYTTKLSTDHKLSLFENKPYRFTLRPSFKYFKVSGGSFEDDSTKNINNIVRRTMQNGESKEGSISVDKTWRATHSGDYLKLETTAYMFDRGSRDFRDYHLTHAAADNLAEYENQFDNNGISQWQWQVKGQYHYALGAYSGLDAAYAFDHVYTKSYNEIYQLHRLTEWDGEKNLGSLPDTDRLSEVIDGMNSSWTTRKENSHELAFSYHYRKMDAKTGSMELYLKMPLRLNDHSLDYRNTTMTTTISRKKLLPGIMLNAAKSIKGKDHSFYFFRISYRLTQTMPSLRDLVSIRNDATPLFVRDGNPNLKNMVTNSIDGSFQIQPKAFGNHTLSIGYSSTNDMVTQSLKYDKETGVSYLKPVNIDGNDRWHLGMSDKFYLGKEYATTIGNTFRLDVANSARMTGTAAEQTLTKSMVRQTVVSEDIELASRLFNGKFQISFAPYYTYSHTSSSRQGFTSFSTHDFGTKTKLNIELPFDIRLSTVATSSFRRGYAYSDMNDDEVIWNADISKSFNMLTLGIGMYDILGQKRNVYRFVDSEKRKEQFYNSIGRFVMLRVSVNINKK